jgi:hypothetical protein
MQKLVELLAFKYRDLVILALLKWTNWVPDIVHNLPSAAPKVTITNITTP